MFILLFPNKKNTQISSYFLDKKSPLLIYDYKIANNRLTYFYWDQKGKNAKSIPFETQNSYSIELRGNQVFYKKEQLTFDKSNKLKPIIVNGKTIIYLSDYDRGIGFYTLRKINLDRLIK